jgi:hypothetical protein
MNRATVPGMQRFGKRSGEALLEGPIRTGGETALFLS